MRQSPVLRELSSLNRGKANRHEDDKRARDQDKLERSQTSKKRKVGKAEKESDRKGAPFSYKLIFHAWNSPKSLV